MNVEVPGQDERRTARNARAAIKGRRATARSRALRIPLDAEPRSVYRRRQGWIVVVVEAKFYIAGMIAPCGGVAEQLGRLDPLVKALFGEAGERAPGDCGVRPQPQRDRREQQIAYLRAKRAHAYVQSSTVEPVW